MSNLVNNLVNNDHQIKNHAVFLFFVEQQELAQKIAVENFARPWGGGPGESIL